MKTPEFKKLSLAEARSDVERDPAELDARKRASERTAQTSGVLLDETSRWLASLPANIRPLACARRYPRIVAASPTYGGESGSARSISIP